MAQLGNGIAGLPIQSGVPVGWTKQTGSTNLDVVSNAETEYSDRAIQFSNLVSTAVITWNSGGSQGDSEVLCLFKMTGTIPSGNWGGGPVIRQQDSVDSGYGLNFSSTAVRLQRAEGGNGILIASSPTINYVTNTWYWVRLRAVGSTISLKFWQVGTSEPGAFQLSATDTTYPIGRLGIRGRTNSFLPFTSAFWVATAGDTATRGNQLTANAALALTSTYKLTPAGVRWGTNKSQLDLSSNWSARFVNKPVNITAAIALASSFRQLASSDADKRKPGEAALAGQSALTANAFIPYKTLPRHYEGDKYRRRFPPEYNEAFNDLLPTGPAWPREPDTTFQKAVAGLSAIWGSLVEQLAEVLLVQESDPRSTVILLPEWERAWGLPDKCLAEPLTIEDRQRALVHKMTLIGAQSRDFFIGVAASIGYKIDIREWSPFMCGISMCGDTRMFNALEAVSTSPNFNVSSDITIDPATEVKYDFEETDSALGWTGASATITPTAFGITEVPTGADPILRSPASLTTIFGGTHRYIAIEIERLVARTAGAWQGQIYYVTAGHGESELFTKKLPILDNNVTGSRITLVADMLALTAGGNDWRDNDITQLRIDLEDGQSGPVTPNGQFRINTIRIGNAFDNLLPPTTSIIVQEDTNNYRWEIGEPTMRFFWAVRVGAVRFTWFRASSGQAGVNHHLEFALATDLECILRRWKPAHTEIIFDYSPMNALDFSKPFDSSYYMIIF